MGKLIGLLLIVAVAYSGWEIHSPALPTSSGR